MNSNDMDWRFWHPRERAVLMLSIRGGQLLLILKKRGLGETPLQAAIREVQEEVCVTPCGVREAGELWFQFVDGHSILGHVFMASDFTGNLQETDEAAPFWVPLSEIPYHNMWADDRIWMPLALAGKPFVGRFLFDGDQMLKCEISVAALS